MTSLAEQWVIPGLALLAEWSVRWGVVIAALAAWLALRPPTRAATRHALCLAVLAAGVLLPAAPRWGDAAVSWPVRTDTTHREPAATVARVSLTENAPLPPSVPDPVRPSPRVERPRSASISTVRIDRPAARAFAPIAAWQLLALASSAGWMAVVLVLTVRSLGGAIALVRLRREAVHADDSTCRLLDECREALGLSRSVRLAIHPSVASPAVVGGFRPVVLVPPGWTEWPEPDRRACLLHELAHLLRYDDWLKLVQEVLRVPFFFHPAVHWLLGRLDRERELLCDEAAVAMGADPVEYARLLFSLARRPGRLLAVGAPTARGCLPFLERRTVKIRIERLLEDDMKGSIRRPSAAGSFLLGGLAIVGALVLGGLRVHAKDDGARVSQSATAPQGQTPLAKKAEAPAPVPIRGVVHDRDGHPVAGATVVLAPYDDDQHGQHVLASDAQGRFAWTPPAGVQLLSLLVHKEGLAAAGRLLPPGPEEQQLRLDPIVPFSAVLVDSEGRPVAGASVRIAIIAHYFEQGNNSGMGFTQVRRDLIVGSPLERDFVTTTDAQGAFTFRVTGSNTGLNLAVTSAEGRALLVRNTEPRAASGRMGQMMDDNGFVTAPPDKPTRLVAVPAARLSGRVVTSLPGVRVAGLKASLQPCNLPGTTRRTSGFEGTVRTDDDGRFVIDGLSDGAVNVFVRGDGENRDWTYRAGHDVELTPGQTAEVTIELIRGVDVEGSVITRGTGAPAAKAQVGVYGPFRPRSGDMTLGATTDAQGHYHYRLPPGETYFYIMAAPEGLTRLAGEGSTRTVTIPEGTTRFRVPPIEVAPAVTVRGRIVDATGAPIAGATVVGTCEGGVCRPFPGTETTTDARGEFHLKPSLYNTIPAGSTARLLIRLKDGAEHEAAANPSGDGSVTIRLPLTAGRFPNVNAPRDVAPDELAGIVVDPQGRPIGGAEVNTWPWHPGHGARTDSRGVFHIRKLEKGSKVEVRVSKEGRTPQLFLTQPTGQPGWVIVLGNSTYFEGRVTGPDGKPVANARLRANSGPKRADGGIINEIWTEATTDDAGHYRMYAQADVYDIQVRVPGVGVARLPGTSLAPDEARHLDIALSRGVTFRAEVADSLTGEPVPGVRLWHWQHPGIEGRSGQDGTVEVPDMMPGPFRFMVEAPGYVRWWSAEASNEWSRYQIDESRGGWQRNFDMIDFEIKPDMKPATITVERGVTITGRVVDPSGKPVAGATVAPALTGTGNSITGDTRFSVETGADGRFTTVLPASGKRSYNLVAHDGKYCEWRTWANGVLPPIQTKPGETLADVELALRRPATVRGRVLDSDGRPIAGREVRASSADRLENRCYDPTTTTQPDGTYELKFIRPGQQFIQVAPFWLDARQAPEWSSRTLNLRAGEAAEGVDFRAPAASKDR